MVVSPVDVLTVLTVEVVLKLPIFGGAVTRILTVPGAAPLVIPKLIGL